MLFITLVRSLLSCLYLSPVFISNFLNPHHNPLPVTLHYSTLSWLRNIDVGLGGVFDCI